MKKRIPRGNEGKGRPKGSKNKFTKSAREAFQFAFDELGGPAQLAEWGKANPTEFYKLYGRLIPVEHTGEDGKPIDVTVIHKHVRDEDDEK